MPALVRSAIARATCEVQKSIVCSAARLDQIRSGVPRRRVGLDVPKQRDPSWMLIQRGKRDIQADIELYGQWDTGPLGDGLSHWPELGQILRLADQPDEIVESSGQEGIKVRDELHHASRSLGVGTTHPGCRVSPSTASTDLRCRSRSPPGSGARWPRTPETSLLGEPLAEGEANGAARAAQRPLGPQPPLATART